MKKAIGMAVIMLFVGSTTAMAQLANSGTGHDFAESVWAGYVAGTTSTVVRGEVCAPCHTPHGSTVSAPPPLWNHVTSSNSSWSMYTSATYSQNAVSAPTGVSGLCLGCHDGVTAMNAYGGGSTAFDSTMASGADGYVGTDLTNDHPISLVYATSKTSDGAKLLDASTVKSTNAGLLPGDKVECSSCHEPHNRGEPMSNNAKYLRISNVGSALCTSCHSM
jgi:predicted CXXCH cytochrome family protein